MKNKFRMLGVLLSIFVLTSCIRCSNLIGNKTRVVSVGEPLYFVTYNTQTFFDAIEDGIEFAEFKGRKTKWTPEMYKTRLLRLREAGELSVQLLGGKKDKMPDVFVLQEIESTRVIEDFAKLFSPADERRWQFFNSDFFEIPNQRLRAVYSSRFTLQCKKPPPSCQGCSRNKCWSTLRVCYAFCCTLEIEAWRQHGKDSNRTREATSATSESCVAKKS